MIDLALTWNSSVLSVRIRMVCVALWVAWIGLNMGWKVPVIAVFTKYDQFKRDIQMKLEDRPGGNGSVSKEEVNDEAECIFQDQYWNVIKEDSPRSVRLESKSHCCIWCCMLLHYIFRHAWGGTLWHPDHGNRKCLEWWGGNTDATCHPKRKSWEECEEFIEKVSLIWTLDEWLTGGQSKTWW